ncbi:hypothetical protein CISIN_1g0418311mg, partial [Citrus sinensis]
KQFVDKKICTNFVAAHGVFLLKLRVSQDAKKQTSPWKLGEASIGPHKSCFQLSILLHQKQREKAIIILQRVPYSNVLLPPIII